MRTIIKERLDMQAIILAAGFGKRLQPLTNTVPKCMVQVNGKPLLVRMLELLENREVLQILIVVGHMKEKVIDAIGFKFGRANIHYVCNNEYNITNNVYSLWLAKDWLCRDSLLIECDLYFHPTILDCLLNFQGECGILVSKYNPRTMNGTVVTVKNNNEVSELIIKEKQRENFDYDNKYKTVNMYNITKEFLEKNFVPHLSLFVRTFDKNSYYELVLGGIIYYEKVKCHYIDVSESLWQEIDNRFDLIKCNEAHL